MHYERKLARKIPKHPSLDIVGSDGAELSGKKIVLCVAGSVAAYKSIELARLLMRHGASVTCVASDAATKLIQPAYFKWATGNPVITKLTGNLEHIAVADYKKSDLIIVYPCTANTLGKLASGIDDTPIATVLTVGFGSGIPLVMCMAVKNEMKKKFDIVIMAAAPSDYTPEKPSNSKIKSTNQKMTVKLTRVPKIIDQVKKLQKDVFLVGFKALARVSKKELENEARRKMKDCKADLMVANDVGSPRYRKNPENNEVLIVDSKKVLSSGWKTKEKIAKLIKKEIERRIAGVLKDRQKLAPLM